MYALYVCVCVCVCSWSRQHEALEKLNMQAVMNAMQQTDEFVKEYLVSYEKVSNLVAWMELLCGWNCCMGGTVVWVRQVMEGTVFLGFLFPLHTAHCNHPRDYTTGLRSLRC